MPRVSRAMSSAGRISYATPSAGMGLMSAATQAATRAGSPDGGMGPMWLSIKSSWPFRRSCPPSRTSAFHSDTSGASAAAARAFASESNGSVP